MICLGTLFWLLIGALSKPEVVSRCSTALCGLFLLEFAIPFFELKCRVSFAEPGSVKLQLSDAVLRW